MRNLKRSTFFFLVSGTSFGICIFVLRFLQHIEQGPLGASLFLVVSISLLTLSLLGATTFFLGFYWTRNERAFLKFFGVRAPNFRRNDYDIRVVGPFVISRINAEPRTIRRKMKEIARRFGFYT